jgi:hypothetical protein
METPKQAEKKSMPNEKFKLPSGKEVEKTPFKGKHVREAQRLMDGDVSKYQFAMISVACLVDGKRITMEELDELDGKDCLSLIEAFTPLFT